jgi:hypothetical protein
MSSNHGSGSKGWGTFLAVVGGIFLVTKLLPAVTRLIGILLGAGLAVILTLIGLVIYFSCKKDNKKTVEAEPARETPKAETPPPKAEPKAIPPSKLSPEAMQILSKGRSHLMELRNLLRRIRNLNVTKRGEDICVEIEKILGALQQQPEDIPMVRQFFNYYLPTLGNILLKYLRLEEAGMATDQTTVRVMSCLGEIKTAMEKQYAAIFENDLLDLTVEMESLTRACKRDGLLVSEDFTLREGDREISLTL